MVRAFREATWEEALSLAAQELLRIRDEHGPDALAALSSAKCSNEDNYAFSGCSGPAFGTNNVDHCTRLCHSTSVAAMKRALNTTAASGSMREIEEAATSSSSPAPTPPRSHPVFGALIKRAVAKRRQAHRRRRAARSSSPSWPTSTCRWMPGTDVALFNAMLHHIIEAGLADPEFIRDRPTTSTRSRPRSGPTRPRAARRSLASRRRSIRGPPRCTPAGPRTSTLWAMGLTQHATGTDIVASLLNLMLACGMIGKWGAAMMPIRGQNNVQGASDVGAIPFVYTDYRPVTDPANRAEFAKAWGVPDESLSLKDGLMVTEMREEDSPVRGLYIMGENPVISDPNIAHAEHWVRGLEFLAVQDLFLTETARWADVVLPGSSFAEKVGTYREHRAADPARLRPP